MSGRGAVRSWALAVAVMTTAACSGPRTPIQVTFQEVPGDILLGETAPGPDPGTPPVPPAANPEPTGFPSFIQPPPPVLESTLPGPASPSTTARQPAPPACARVDPLATPPHPASRNIAGPPARQDLPFRNDGEFEVADSSGVQRGRYPEQSIRSVVPGPGRTDGTFTFAVTEATAGTTTTTSYLVDPGAGLYLTGQQTTDASGTDTFAPTDPRSLRLLPLPATIGAEISGIGVDATRQTTMRISGKVEGVRRITGCGIALDAWRVVISEGRVVAPNKQLVFTASYAVGTQYGGVTVQEEVSYACDPQVPARCDRGRRVQTHNVATTAREPLFVQGTAG